MSLRRVRGLVLRLVRRRGLAVLVGVALVAPSAWIEFAGGGGSWWMDGLALVVGATGLAVLWTGLTGLAPDWVDDANGEETEEPAANRERGGVGNGPP
jgi:hypothetical protein